MDIYKSLFEHFVKFLNSIDKPHYVFEDEYRIRDATGTTVIAFNEPPRYYTHRFSGHILIDLGDPKCIKKIEKALRDYY